MCGVCWSVRPSIFVSLLSTERGLFSPPAQPDQLTSGGVTKGMLISLSYSRQTQLNVQAGLQPTDLVRRSTEP